MPQQASSNPWRTLGTIAAALAYGLAESAALLRARVVARWRGQQLDR